MNKYKKKKCGITGSKGVLGSEIIKSKKFKFIKFKGDITKKKEVNEWVKSNSFDLMIHLAAIVPVKKVIQEYNKAKKVNYIGTKNLINSIIKYETGLKWFFFASYSHVYNFNKSSNYIIAGEQVTNASIDGAIESGLLAAKKALN